MKKVVITYLLGSASAVLIAIAAVAWWQYAIWLSTVL